MPIEVIGTIEPKNNNTFPVVKAKDVEVSDVQRLPAALAELKVFCTPQMYGAVANGEADDTLAIQQAVDQGGVVFFPKGTYKITSTINVTSAVEIVGEGSEESVITGSISDFIFKFGTTPKRWYPSFYKVSRIGCTNTGSGGTMEFSNATQSYITGCRLSAPQYEDQDNLVITNESHWIVINNNFIIGGNGVTVDVSCNGVTITNNYVSYCNKGINMLGGGQHKIVHNDVEGYNKKPYILSCGNSEIECWGERNKPGNWVEINGNYNNISVIMYSDGGSYYKPLIKLSGNNNKILIKQTSGYTLFEGDDAITGEYNEITIQRCRTLTNRELMKAPATYSKTKFNFGDQDLLFSEHDDITQLITNDPSDYTYNPDTQILVFQSNNKIVFDFSSIIPENVQGYFYLETQGISYETHGRFVYSPAYNSQEVLSANDRIISLSGYTSKSYPRTIESEIGIPSQAIKIKKLRLSSYITNKLLSDIETPGHESESNLENSET